MPLPSRPRVVVTGAGSGLGRAFCEALATRGARMVISDVNPSTVEETRALLGGADVRVATCDVTKPDDVERLARIADDAFGGTDLVINNAGVAAGGRIGDVPLADWRWIVDVNLFGVIHGCHTFVPRFRAAGSGHVLNVASVAGLVSMPNLAPYHATKYAVVAISEALRAEVDGTGIGVTVLCPSFFKTNIARNGRSSGEGTAEERKDIDRVMERTKVQAPQVADYALNACDRGDLYALPHAEGRWAWRIKRVAPTFAATRLSALAQRAARRSR